MQTVSLHSQIFHGSLRAAIGGGMEIMMKQTQPYELGLVSVSFRKNAPREILEAMRHADLSQIEWGSDIHAPCDDIARLKELAAMQQEFGIACSSYGTYFKLGDTPIEQLEQYMEAASLLGTRILRLWCGTKSGKVMTAQEKEVLLAQCRLAADLAQKNGMTLCMEHHRNTLTEEISDTLALMEALHSPHFRMYWQPFQWLEPSENLEQAKALSPYTEHIHVFQWKGKQRFPLSEGIEEWRNYMPHFPAPRTLLLEFMPDDRIETLPCEAEALRAIIA